MAKETRTQHQAGNISQGKEKDQRLYGQKSLSYQEKDYGSMILKRILKNA